MLDYSAGTSPTYLAICFAQAKRSVDDDCLSLAGQRFSDTLNLDLNLQTNPSASS
jgi:hypothetical protein